MIKRTLYFGISHTTKPLTIIGTKMKHDEADDITIKISLLKGWAKINLAGKGFLSPIGIIQITMKGIKETINQPHKWKHEKNHAIYVLPDLLERSEYAGSAVDVKGKVKEYHYLEITINNAPSFIVIKETWQGSKHFYSIVDKIKGK